MNEGTWFLVTFAFEYALGAVILGIIVGAVCQRVLGISRDVRRHRSEIDVMFSAVASLVCFAAVFLYLVRTPSSHSSVDLTAVERVAVTLPALLPPLMLVVLYVIRADWRRPN